MSRQPADPDIWDRHCTTLGVGVDFTAEDLRSAYKRQCLKSHPDKNPGRESEAEREFKELQHAYAYLIDPANRRNGAGDPKGDYDPNFFYDEEFFGDVFFNFFASRSNWGSDGRGCNCIHCRTTHMAFLQRTCAECGKKGEHEFKCDTCATYWCTEKCRTKSKHKAPRDCESRKEKARESFIPESLKKTNGKKKKKKKKKAAKMPPLNAASSQTKAATGGVAANTGTPRTVNDFIGALDYLDAVKEDYHGQNLFQQLEMLVWTLDDQHFNEYGELCDEQGLGSAMSSHLKVFLADYPLIAQQYNRFVMPQFQIALSSTAIRAAEERQAELARMRAEEARRQLQEAQRKTLEAAARRREKKKAKRVARAQAKAQDKRQKEEERVARLESQVTTLLNEMPQADRDVVRDFLVHCNGSTKGARKVVALSLEFPLLTPNDVKTAMQKGSGNVQQARKVLEQAQRKEKRHHAERERIERNKLVKEKVAQLASEFPMIDRGEIKKCIEPLLPDATDEQLTAVLQPLVAVAEKVAEERRLLKEEAQELKRKEQAAKDAELANTLLSLFSSLSEADIQSLMKKHDSADAVGAAALQLDQKRKRGLVKNTIQRAGKRFPKIPTGQIERIAREMAGDWKATVQEIKRIEEEAKAKAAASAGPSRKQKKKQRKLQEQLEQRKRAEERNRLEEERRLREEKARQQQQEEARAEAEAEAESRRLQEAQEAELEKQRQEQHRQQLHHAAALNSDTTSGEPALSQDVYSWLSRAGLGDIAGVVMQQADVTSMRELAAFGFNELSLFALPPEQRARLQSALEAAGLGSASAAMESPAVTQAAPASWGAPSAGEAFPGGWLLGQIGGVSGAAPPKRPLWTSSLPAVSVNAFPVFSSGAELAAAEMEDSPPAWWSTGSTLQGLLGEDAEDDESLESLGAAPSLAAPLLSSASVTAASVASVPEQLPGVLVTSSQPKAPRSGAPSKRAASPVIAKPRRPMCDLWLRKECKMSAKCPKLHDRPCRFASTGRECAFGSNCSFLHSGDPGFRISKRYESKIASNEKAHAEHAQEAQRRLHEMGGQARLSEFASGDMFPADRFEVCGSGGRALVRTRTPTKAQLRKCRGTACPLYSEVRASNRCEWGDSCRMAHPREADSRELAAVQTALANKSTFLSGVKSLHRLVNARQRHIPLELQMQLLTRIGQLIGPKMRLNCLKLVADILRVVAQDDVPEKYLKKVQMLQQQCQEATIARAQKNNKH